MSRHPAFPLSSRMFGFAWVSSSITDTGGSIEAGWHEGRYLVVPTYLKDISTNAALLSLWNRAADALANAAQVIVIGYRLDTSDALARQLIALALLRNSKLKEIVVISPPDGPNHWDAFALTVGKQRKLVRLKFEEWILGPTILTT